MDLGLGLGLGWVWSCHWCGLSSGWRGGWIGVGVTAGLVMMRKVGLVNDKAEMAFGSVMEERTMTMAVMKELATGAMGGLGASNRKCCIQRNVTLRGVWITQFYDA